MMFFIRKTFWGTIETRPCPSCVLVFQFFTLNITVEVDHIMVPVKSPRNLEKSFVEASG